MTANYCIPGFVIGFERMPKPVVDVWRRLSRFLAVERALPKSVELSQVVGHSEQLQSDLTLKVPVERVEKLILERGLSGFMIYAGAGSKGVQYFLKDSRGARQDYLIACHLENEAKAPRCWASLIEGIISEHPSVGAWQYISLYHAWQRKETIDRFYEMRWGSVPPGYRTWTEPFPGPIPQPEVVHVDVSRNPGRTKHILPSVEVYPTAEMWLGPHFWKYVKCKKEEALAADFFIEKRDTPHYLYLRCWPEPFTRPDGEQGRMQQRLWKLFFHEDCEWPPGSGSICDEPIYGPPELMPCGDPEEHGNSES